MAELIGLIASIGTIASAGITVARLVAALADELGTAGARVGAISTETKALAFILHELRRRLRQSRNVSKQVIELATEIADLCKSDIEAIRKCLEPLFPSQQGNMDIRQKARWLFTKSKIATRQTSLDSLKHTLTLFLHTLDFAQGDVIDEEYIHDEIKHMVNNSKEIKANFIHAERVDQFLETTFPKCESPRELSPYDDGESHASHEAASQEGTGDEQEDHFEAATSEALVILQDHETAMQATGGPNAQYQQETRTDFDIILALSDDAFLHIAAHIHMQKAVTHYALLVVEESHDDVVSSPSAVIPIDGIEASAPEQSDCERSTHTHDSNSMDSPRRRKSPISQAGQDHEIADVDNGESWAFRTSDTEPHTPYRRSHRESSERARLSDWSEPGGVNYRDSEDYSNKNQSHPSIGSRAARPRDDYFPYLGRGRDGSQFPPHRDDYFPYLGRGRDGSQFPPHYREETMPSASPGYDFRNEHPASHNPLNSSSPAWQNDPPSPFSPYYPPHLVPPPSTFPTVDVEKEALKKQLALMIADQKRKEEDDKRRELEARIREEAEITLQRKFEQVRRDEEVRAEERRLALEQAKKEIDGARQDAHRAARQALEAEMKAEQERATREAEATARAEREARDKIEAAMKAEDDERQKKKKRLRRLMLGSGS